MGAVVAALVVLFVPPGEHQVRNGAPDEVLPEVPAPRFVRQRGPNAAAPAAGVTPLLPDLPEGVEVVETDRGGKSTYHGPGQLVCYPIFDLTRHGQDVQRYCRDLEEALIVTLAKLGVAGERIDGLTGVWLTRPPRKIASIGIHISKWVTTHGYALNVDLDPAPFTQWITACGLEDAACECYSRVREYMRTLVSIPPHE